MELFISNFKNRLDPDYILCNEGFGYWIYKKEGVSHNDFEIKIKKREKSLLIIFGKKRSLEKVNSLNNIIDDINSTEFCSEFVTIEIKENSEIFIFSERNGLIPLYYKIDKDEFLLTTEEFKLYDNFSINDIDIIAVNDYLRYGTLIGNSTFSNKIRLIEGGCILSYINKKIQQERYYLFHYNDDSSIKDISVLIDKISKAFIDVIKNKISENDLNETCLFMSGGMDSRFILALLNNIYKNNQINTVCFGQKYSEEVDIARKCAIVNNNSFEHIEVIPKDFLEEISEYSKLTCGEDMFPQSYIILMCKKLKYKKFITGYILDALLGGTFLNEECLNTNKKFSDFIIENKKLVKMNNISDDVLKFLCKPDVYEKNFINKDSHLISVASEYDDFSVKDVIQSFGINNRAKRLVLLRELVPSKFINYECISLDAKLLETISCIPADERLNHKFYQKLMFSIGNEYSNIVYNNTNLPITADINLWDLGTKNESNREKLYEEIMKKSKDNINYYPHYYSDFNGYSRYDKEWKSLFNQYILNNDAIINILWFDHKKIRMLYEEHISSKRNHRKILVYLTSLEIFLRKIIKKEDI